MSKASLTILFSCITLSIISMASVAEARDRLSEALPLANRTQLGVIHTLVKATTEQRQAINGLPYAICELAPSIEETSFMTLLYGQACYLSNDDSLLGIWWLNNRASEIDGCLKEMNSANHTKEEAEFICGTLVSENPWFMPELPAGASKPNQGKYI